MPEQETIKDLYKRLIKNIKNNETLFNSILKTYIMELFGEGIQIKNKPDKKYIYLQYINRQLFYSPYYCIFSIEENLNEVIDEIIEQKYLGDNNIDIDLYIMINFGDTIKITEEDYQILENYNIKQYSIDAFIDDIVINCPSIFKKFKGDYFNLSSDEYTSILSSLKENIFIIENQNDKNLKIDLFPFLKPKQNFIQDISRDEYLLLRKRLSKLKEKCGTSVSKEDCEKCNQDLVKVCITKLFAYHLSRDILSHCGSELADSYWISENKGYAVVIKGANMRTKIQFTDPFMQINELSQLDTINIIFYANSKPTSNKFFSDSLNLCKSRGKRFLIINRDELAQLLYFYENNKSIFEEIRTLTKITDIEEIFLGFSKILKSFKTYLEELVINNKVSKFREIQEFIRKFIIQYFQNNNYKVIRKFIFEYLDYILNILYQLQNHDIKFYLQSILNALFLFNKAIQEKQGTDPLSIKFKLDASLEGLENPDPVSDLFGSMLQYIINLPEKFVSIKKEPRIMNSIGYIFSLCFKTIYNTLEIKSFEKFFNITIYPYFKEFLENYFSLAIQDTQIEDKIFFLLTPYITIDRIFNPLADSQLKLFSELNSSEGVLFEEFIDKLYKLFLEFFDVIPIYYHKEFDFQKYFGFIIRPYWFPNLFYSPNQIHNLTKVRSNLISFLNKCKNEDFIRINGMLHYSFRYFYQFLNLLITRNYEFLKVYYSEITENNLKIHKSLLSLFWEIHKFWLNYAKEYPELNRIDDDDLLLEFFTRGLLFSDNLLRNEYKSYLIYVQKCFEFYLNIKNEDISNQNKAELSKFHEIFENLIFLLNESIPSDIGEEVEKLISELILKMEDNELKSIYYFFLDTTERGYYLYIDKIKTDDEESTAIVWKTLGDDNEPLKEIAKAKINDLIMTPILEKFPEGFDEETNNDELW